MKTKICQNCKKEYTTRGIKYCRDCGYLVNLKATGERIRIKRESENKNKPATAE